jgi:pyruvate dehydrogenase E2 component (dihydrolipoamide acetyltransferase)
MTCRPGVGYGANVDSAGTSLRGAAGPVRRVEHRWGDAMARVLRMPVVSDPGSARLTAWLVGEAGDFAGSQSLATIETDSSVVSIEANEPGVLIRSLVAPGQHVAAGTALALLASPGEVIEDVEQLMVRLGLAVAPEAQVPGAHLRAMSAADPLGATTWPPHEAVEQENGASAPVESVSAGLVDEAVVRPLVGWVDTVAEALATSVILERASADPPAEVRHLRLRAFVRADPLVAVAGTVDSVSLIGLVVKAVANTCRRFPLRPDPSTIASVALQRRTPSGTFAPVLHVADLMTASSLTSIIADLDLRARQGRMGPARCEAASVLVVDLSDEGVAEGALDATEEHPAILVLGHIHSRPVVADGVLVPAQVLGVTLSCDANRVELASAARWFAELSRLLEQPLQFLT